MPITNAKVPGTRTVTMELPNSIFIRNADGKPLHWDLREVPDALFPTLFEKGVGIRMINAFNGGGADRPVSVRVDKLSSVLKAWDQGTYEVTERAPHQATLIREAWRADMRAVFPTASDADIDNAGKAKVKERFGKDTNASIEMVIRATAMELAEADGEERDVDTIEALLVDKYEKAAAVIEAERAKAASAKVDFAAIKGLV